MPDRERDLDIVLFGATGFVGALTAAHLAEHAPEGARIALAGRSRPSSRPTRAEIGGRALDWQLVVVDATDATGLRALAARTTVLASTVGPYAAYGKEVVRACAEEGTHYADLTGEVLFVRWSLDEVDARARETGAAIVHACGFDSIPSDLGVLVTAQRARCRRRGRARRDDVARAVDEGRLLRRHHRLRAPAGDHDARRRVAPAARSPTRMRLSPRRSEEPSGGGRQRSAGRARGHAAPLRADRPRPCDGALDRARS